MTTRVVDDASLKEIFVHARAIQRFDLSNRIIWVPGGAGLLGSAVSTALAEHGATVIVSDVRGDVGEKLADDIRKQDLIAHAMTLDASSEESIVACRKSIVERFGKLDAMVNMTFRYENTPWEKMTTKEFEYGMRVSSTGAFLLSREAALAMLPNGKGSIVHFSSMYGVVAPNPKMYPEPMNPNPVDYGIAKAGVLALVRYHAVALAEKGIRVNAIVPGPFPYPWGPQTNEEFMKRLAAKVPMGRVGNALEIAGAVVFLCSDGASFVTGTQIAVDGGWTAQ
jgi:NAD(P)-dependent dehydrogenase (short-subunit alcohol dehydrogenase family)